MNAFTPFSIQTDRARLKKNEAVSILERFCSIVEPTETQKQTAKDRYNAVGQWLADAAHYLFGAVQITAQGSFALGTAIKPLTGDEYDVDLLCRFIAVAGHLGPAQLKHLLGGRLRENGRYQPILIEKQRCWRLNFAGEFHMDITPSVPNPACLYGGELVPDKKLRSLKPTNPAGYLKLFEQRAALSPTFNVLESFTAMDHRGIVAPFPEHSGFKGILRRIVQLLKRHRDIYFENADPSLRPISVILTTLASRAYEAFVEKYRFDTEFDVMVAVVQAMPSFIETYDAYGKPRWLIVNETTQGENFAEKWNLQPELQAAFVEWHGHVLSDVQRLAALEGRDVVTKSLGQSFGNQAANKVASDMADEVNAARRGGSLFIAPSVGLVTGPATTARATPVRTNTFFGSE